MAGVQRSGLFLSSTLYYPTIRQRC
jgi:hypothetical protein